MSKKYQKLTTILPLLYEEQNNNNFIVISYATLEELLGFKLPKTAYKDPDSFWANSRNPTSRASSWLSVGFETTMVSDTELADNPSIIFQKVD